jgi:hypothetical protein
MRQWIVQHQVVCAQLRQPASLLDHAGQVRHVARERQAGVEPAARLAYGGGGGGEVLDVVQRIVQPEDLDPALGRAEDEAADEVVGQGLRPDQEAAAHGHLQRRLPAAGGQRPNALPGALDSPMHRRFEAATAGHLHRCETRVVEDLGHLEQPRGRHRPHQRLLRQQPDGRVDDAGHAREM